MNSWQELIKFALLGTEKLPLQLQILPEAIRQQMSASAEVATDVEAQFLYATALTRLYERAGRKATVPPENAVAPSVAPDETQPFAPPQYQSLLKRLLDKNNLWADLLGLFLAKMAGKGYVLPHFMLVEFLNTVSKKELESCQLNAKKVLGERGKWLIGMNTGWEDFSDEREPNDWENLNVRRLNDALTKKRINDPQRVFDFIQKDWRTSGARVQITYLQILCVNPQANELPFFQTLYDEMTERADFKKDIVREMYLELTACLLSNPASDLFKKAVFELKNYVLVKKQLLGLRSNSVLALPSKENDFFNTENMTRQFGFLSLSRHQDLQEIGYWFSEFCQKLHPTAWEQVFETTDWNKIIGAFEKIEGVKTKGMDAIFSSLLKGLNNHPHRPAVLALKDLDKLDFDFLKTFSVLTIKELEVFVTSKTSILNSIFALTALRNFAIERTDWQWSRMLSLNILRGGILSISNLNHVARCLDLGVFLHPSVLDDLYQEVRRDLGNDYQQYELRRRVVQPLIQIMEFKKEIEYLP
jgi:hypothetical protein